MIIFIKTISEEVSDDVTVSLMMDEDGMKYSVCDRRLGKPAEEHPLSIEVPALCRREIRRRFIPNVDGKTGVLPKNCVISQMLDDFIFKCWEMILEYEPQLVAE